MLNFVIGVTLLAALATAAYLVIGIPNTEEIPIAITAVLAVCALLLAIFGQSGRRDRRS